ncbi:hypothetical protein [Arthrobacter sp. LAR12-1-1.1]|uniref:hypothetical protein n=1 Tax=Arthrobacter sp. LAR12-1-1.1 TaxID=3135215 RepID=UPI003431F7AD
MTAPLPSELNATIAAASADKVNRTEAVTKYAPLARLDRWATDAFAAPGATDVPAVTVTRAGFFSSSTTGTIAGATLIREKRIGDVSTANLDIAGDTHFRIKGAPSGIPEDSGNQQANFVKTPFIPGQSTVAWTWSIETDMVGAEIEYKFRCVPTSFAYMLRVNGRWVTETQSLVTGLIGGGTFRFKLTFPDARPRTVELFTRDAAFGGAWASTGTTLVRTPAPITPADRHCGRLIHAGLGHGPGRGWRI